MPIKAVMELDSPKPKKPMSAEKLQDIKDMEFQLIPSLPTIDAALSNFVILKEIFSNLSHEDMLNCCKVSKTWYSVLDPLICYYGITLKSGKATRRSTSALCRVEVEEILGFAGNSINERTDLKAMIERLGHLRKHKLISIDLKLILKRERLNLDRDLFLTFLKEFGDRVHILDCQSTPDPFDFEENLLHLSYLRNIQVLKCNKLWFFSHQPETIASAWAGAGIRVFPDLWKLYFGDYVHLNHWEYLLGAAPNVKELMEVPIRAHGVIERFNKVEAVKSIIFTTSQCEGLEIDDNLRLTEYLLERFSGLGVKLRVGAVPNIYHIVAVGDYNWNPDGRCAQNIKEYTHRILESSKDTLKVVTIPAAKSSDFYFPTAFQMKGVKILQFEDDSDGLEYETIHWYKKEIIRPGRSVPEYHYFLKGTDMKSNFPSLEGLTIKFELLKRHLIKFFPPDIFGPEILGSSVKKLKIQGTSPDCFPDLVSLFPHLTHLEMESTLAHFKLVFPTLARGWERMENLIVFIESSKGFHCDAKGCNLDSVLTGIPDHICGELLRGGRSRKKISREEIAKLQEAGNLSLFSMKNLRKLEFVIEGLDFYCGTCYKNHTPNFITAVTADYAFKQLEVLEVNVRMSKGLNAFDELKDALDPIADFISIDNRYVSPEVPFL